MRPVTDSHKASRAKLAYIIDSTAAPICIIAPISSWAAAVNSYVPADAGISGFQLFLRTIPYNLYAILTIAMVFYICYTGFDFGQMKLHEDNAAKGDVFTTGGEEFEQVSEQEVNPNGKVIDLVLPVAVLIVSAIGAMVYTGFLGGADNVISAFAGCDAETSLIFASVVTILFMMALYLPRKVITFKSFMDSLSEGFKLMVPAVTILVFAWTLKASVMRWAWPSLSEASWETMHPQVFLSRWCCSPWRCSFPFRREPPGERSRFLCRLQRACSPPEQIWR